MDSMASMALASDWSTMVSSAIHSLTWPLVVVLGLRLLARILVQLGGGAGVQPDVAVLFDE